MDTEPILTIRASRAKVALMAAPALIPLAVAAAALALTHPASHGSTATRLIIAASLVSMVGLVGLAYAAKLRGDPAVTMSPKGFRHKTATRDAIPWSAITAIQARRGGGGTVSLSLDSTFAAAYRGPPAHRLRAAFGFTDIRVPTRDLDVTAHDLADAAETYRSAALGIAPPLAGVPVLPDRRASGFKPFATVGLVAVLGAVFALEVMLAPARETATTLSALTMALDGGLARTLVAAGQWWRFLTAPLLHGGPGHLLGNVVALLLGGILLERRIGHAWFLVIFAGGALAGGAASVLLDDPRTVTVGASGGITGLLAAVLVFALVARSEERWALLNIAGRMLIGALVPTKAAQAAHVDFAAHFGGALGGIVLGLIAAARHDAETARVQRRPVVRACAIAWVAATLGALGLDVWTSGTYRIKIAERPDASPRTTVSAEPSPSAAGAARPPVSPAAADAPTERTRCFEQRAAQAPPRMAPNFPSDFDAQKRRSAALVEIYGRDPRVRYARAAALYDADRNDVAEVDLRCAIDDAATWTTFPYVQSFILTLLARIKHDAGHDDEARRLVLPLCTTARSRVEAADLEAFCPARGADRPAN